MSNIIASELQLTETLDVTLTSFKRTVLPINMFSTGYEVELQGDGTVTVPHYGLEQNRSGRRKPGQSYKSKAKGTSTGARQIKPNRNAIQGLSFTSEEARRQPKFDPVKHGMLKGQRLGYDVTRDIFGGIASGIYTGTSIPAISAENFDESTAAKLAEICDEDNWPEEGRGLILRSKFHYNLAQQPALLDRSQSGSEAVLRTASLPPVMGFQEVGTAGLPTNNFGALSFQGASADDTLTVTLTDDYDDEEIGDYFVDGAKVVIAQGGTLPTGLAAGVYYVRDLDETNNKLKLTATPGGDPVVLTANGSNDNTITRKEDIGGIVTHASGLLVGFAPVPPTDGVREKLVDYRQIVDDETDLVLEYTHIAYDDTKEEAQFIECHYGMAPGEKEAIKIIPDADL